LSNNNTILLNDLKGHSIVPPNFLFENIKNKIEEDNTNLNNAFKSLMLHSVAPPASTISFGAIMNRIKETDQLNTFKPLRDYEVNPPFSFTKLMEIIRGMVTTTSIKPTAKVFSFAGNFKRIAAAAAVLLMCFVGYLIYQKTITNEQEEGSTASTTVPTTLPNTTPSIIIPPILDSNDITSSIDDNPTLAFIGNNRYDPRNKFGARRDGKKSMMFGATPSTKDVPLPTEFLINGSRFTIVDNDYLATFASFNESNLPEFLKADIPVATQITIDDYASITITQGMGAMMKKMYKTKKSGKPTRRARKQKEKLEKWKKADAIFFNPNANLNPLDPIDLGNFILYK
jgi:hypothetical protein